MKKNQNVKLDFVKLDLTNDAKKRLRRPTWGFKEEDICVAFNHLGESLEVLSWALTKREQNIAEARFDRLFEPSWVGEERWERELIDEELDIIKQELGTVIAKIVFVLTFGDNLAPDFITGHYSSVTAELMDELDNDEYCEMLEKLYPSPPERLLDLLYEKNIVKKISFLFSFFIHEIHERYS